jgi:hypothetical protein
VKKQQPPWQRIVDFYAGQPTQLDFDAEKQPGNPWPENGWGGTWDGSRINIGPFQKRMLDQLLASKKGPQFGHGTMAGLTTLIHEAVHARKPQPGTGFREWNNENQANALGSELIPDLLQRFFGIKIGSALSNKLTKESKGLSSYLGSQAEMKQGR